MQQHFVIRAVQLSFNELLREVTSRGFTKLTMCDRCPCWGMTIVIGRQDAMTRALVDMPETVERLSKMLQPLHDKHVIS